MTKIIKVYDKIEYFFAAIGGGMLAIMTLWLFADMVGRYVFHHPLPATVEVGEEIFMISVIYLGMGITQKYHEHVRMDAVLEILPAKARNVCEKIADILMFVCMAIFAKYAWDQVMYCIEFNAISRSSLEYPTAPCYFVLFLGWVLLSIRSLLQLFEPAGKKGEDREKKEGEAT